MKVPRSFLVFLLLPVATTISEPLFLHSKEENHQERGTITAHRFLTEGPINIIIKYSSEEGKLRAKKRTEERYRLTGAQSRYKKELPNLNVEIREVDSLEEYLALESDEDVEYVEEDQKRYFFNAHSVSRNLAEEIPYGINMVRALDVDDEHVGNRRVCVIDTGYDITHEDLPKASTGSSVTGTDGVNGVPWNEDDHGHGSHCAGTIAAVGNNNKGVVGVNRNGKLNLHIVRVFGVNGSWIYGTDLITAVEQCRDAGSNVVSMSLGGGGYSQTENDAYKSIYENDGVLLVAAAGNDGNSAYSYPASYTPVMSVAAIDIDKNKAGFSQFNDQVDIAAPGVSVKSTLPGNSYQAWSGTSMATPHVSGVAALIWSHYPEKPATEIRKTLEGSAEDLGVTGRDNSFGHGLVRADLAIFALSNGQYTNAPTISPAPSPKPTVCNDYPPGWYDSDGPYYDCEWYAEGRNCDYYGSGYRNFGYVANEACCVCGGGLRGPPDTPNPTVTVNPSSLPVAPPSAKPTSSPSKDPSSRPSSSHSPSGSPSVSPSSKPSSLPSFVPSESPSVSPSVKPSLTPSSFPSTIPTAGPTTQPSSLPSLSPSASPSNIPSNSIVAIVQTFAKSDLIVTCPFNRTEVEEFVSSYLFTELNEEGVSIDISVTILNDASCTSLRRRLESLNVEALIESTVIIRDDSKNFTTDTLLDAATNATNDKVTVSSVEVIEWPSAPPSALPSMRPSFYPSKSPSSHPSDSPSMVPTARPTSFPSAMPSDVPSVSPSFVPSASPSSPPSGKPSSSPTDVPSLHPSGSPTDVPSTSPSLKPTTKPSKSPSDSPSLSPSVGPTNIPSPSPSSAPTYLPSSSPSKTPTESPSINPTRLPTFSPYPTANPTPQSYLTCRTRKVNRRKKRCIRTPGCRWVRGVNWKQRCQPITPAPTSRPSRNPSHSMPSISPSAPVIDIVHVFSRADLVVTCPFNKTEVEELISSDLIAALQQDGLSIEITTTTLGDVSCTEVGLESLTVAALIESIVVIHDELTSYNPIMLHNAAVTNIKSSVYEVSSMEFIESPSSAPSASPSSSPTWKPSAFPTSAVPSLRPTENPTPQSFLACRKRKANRRRRICIRTPGCRWVRDAHWTQRCQPIIAN